VHAPALGETFAASKGRGATLNGAIIRAAGFAALDGARVAGPRPMIAAFAAQAGFRAEPAPRMPSLAYRLCSVAAGRSDIGLATGNSHDWDIAAADVILREAGAGLREGGAEISYNQARTRHDPLLAAPLEWLPRLASAVPGGQA
jgi:myo-inositol-1(or 4)-monophosphatase